jgi:hypothetical protein
MASLGLGSRRRAAALLAAGFALVLVGFVLPAPLVRAEGNATLDALMPRYHFHEVHTQRIHAGPERVFAAIKAVTAGEIRLYRTLTWIRSPRLRSGGRVSLMNAPPGMPILEAARQSGFLTLADHPDREVAFGGVMPMWRPNPDDFRGLTREGAEAAVARDPSAFARFDPTGCAKVAAIFVVEPEEPGWSRVTTETRVFATSPGTRRAFTVYWRLIYPGSALIRRMWLDAIRRRAEAGS